jgi:hypothetical protein
MKLSACALAANRREHQEPLVVSSEHYPHKVAAVYPDEQTAQVAVKALGSAALTDVRVVELAPGDADVNQAITSGNGAASAEAPVLFVSAPVVAALIVLGYGAVIGKTAGAIYGLRLRERILAGLAKDSLKAGCHVVILHAASSAACRQAEAVIRESLPARPAHL